jgi:arabinan endo-1,5-alpha-L-arabinosidase
MRWILRTALLAAAALVVAGCAARPEAGQAGVSPRAGAGAGAGSDTGIHDPTLIRSGGTYYLFGTGNGVARWTSTDMVNWQALPPVFAEAQPWIQDVVPRFRNSRWAPDIYEHDGTFYLYYSVSAFGRNTSAIGVATTRSLDSQHPDYGWTDHGIVVESVPGRDMWNAIDSHVIHDGEGVPWMSFGSHWGGIKLVKLEPSLTRIAEPQEWHTIAARHRYWKLDERDAGDSANPELDYETLYPARLLALNQASQSGAIEAPVILHRDGYYYLFVSWDRCCRGVNSTYKVVVGRSPDIRGPYMDKEGQNLAHGGGSLVVFGFGGDGRFAAGGHNDVFSENGVDYIVLHAYDREDEGRSKLVIRALEWDRYGWPSASVDVPF